MRRQLNFPTSKQPAQPAQPAPLTGVRFWNLRMLAPLPLDELSPPDGLLHQRNPRMGPGGRQFGAAPFRCFQGECRPTAALLCEVTCGVRSLWNLGRLFGMGERQQSPNTPQVYWGVCAKCSVLVDVIWSA